MAFRQIKQPPEPPAPSEYKPKSLGPMPPSPEEMQNIFTTVLAENPWVADTDSNGSLIACWVEKNNGGRYSLEAVRVAVQVLKNEFEKAKPQAPPQLPPESEPEEVLLPGQLSIRASEWELKQPGVTPAQIRDYLRRVREAEQR